MLKILTLDLSAEWDKTVKSFSEYDVYWLSDYVKGFNIHGDGEPMLFCYEDDSCRGVNVVMKRDISDCPAFRAAIPKNTYFDFCTPYGYGGWLIEGTRFDRLFEEYDLWCVQNRIVSEFVRFHPVIGNHRCVEEAYNVIGLGNSVCMDIGSKEIVFKNLSSKNRNMIRKARNNGVQIKHGKSHDLYEGFKEVYEETMRNVSAAPYYYFSDEYYRSICDGLCDNAEIFYAEKDGVLISGAIMLFANGKMNYHLSGTLNEFRHYAPGNLLLYEAALWGAANGLKTLHLGGGVGSENDSLYHFKKEFNRAKPLSFYIGKRIVNQDVYRELVRLSGVTEATGFFPTYRAVIKSPTSKRP